MNSIYNNILASKVAGKKLLAVLIDPEKMSLQNIPSFFEKLHASVATHIFVGGSTDINNQTEKVVVALKKATHLPVVLFPGDVKQVTAKADGILFLSLLSGRNPTYLIDQQVLAAPVLQKTNLEIIPTGYILIDGGTKTATQQISNTTPINQNDSEIIINTSLAGEYSGKKMIYLEAGSGAIKTVNNEIVKQVAGALTIPLIVGGGVRTKMQLDKMYNAGADMVVIGTAFEQDENLFNDLKK